MWLEGVPSDTYNVYAYKFERQDDAIHEGSNDDKEHMELVDSFKITSW